MLNDTLELIFKEVNNIIILTKESFAFQKEIQDASGKSIHLDEDVLEIALKSWPEWIKLSNEERRQKIVDPEDKFRIQEKRKLLLEQEIPSMINSLEKLTVSLQKNQPVVSNWNKLATLKNRNSDKLKRYSQELKDLEKLRAMENSSRSDISWSKVVEKARALDILGQEESAEYQSDSERVSNIFAQRFGMRKTNLATELERLSVEIQETDARIHSLELEESELEKKVSTLAERLNTLKKDAATYDVNVTLRDLGEAGMTIESALNPAELLLQLKNTRECFNSLINTLKAEPPLPKEYSA